MDDRSVLDRPEVPTSGRGREVQSGDSWTGWCRSVWDVGKSLVGAGGRERGGRL